MTVLKPLLTILILSLLSSPVGSETIDDFVERDGKYYLKFTENPFSGKVEGRVQGTLKDGLWNGKYTKYHENGQLEKKGNYKNGKREGLWEWYNEDGQLYGKRELQRRESRRSLGMVQ